MKTLTIPKFKIKVNDTFNLEFSEDGTMSHNAATDQFRPALPVGPVTSTTPPSQHTALKTGEVRIGFATPHAAPAATTHTILIGN